MRKSIELLNISIITIFTFKKKVLKFLLIKIIKPKSEIINLFINHMEASNNFPCKGLKARNNQ